MRPRLLDLFAGGGGAGMGYHRAGFEVVGVDIAPQPRYPFEFHRADAMTFPLAGFDAIHASPPCQLYSVSTAGFRAAGKTYPDLIAPTRDRLVASGLPWVIENVPGAPLRADFELCGCLFALPGLKRERWFETNWADIQMRAPCHHPDPIVTVIGHGPNQHSPYRHVPGAQWTRLKQAAMGIDWMNREELAEAIPPAYCEFIGEQLMSSLLLDDGRPQRDSLPARIDDTGASLDRKTGSRSHMGGPEGSASSLRSSPARSVASAASSLQSGRRQDASD